MIRAFSRSDLRRAGACLVFAVGLASYVAYALSSAGSRGVWFDEYWSLYFVDPSTPISLWLADTNTPFYYAVGRMAWLLGFEGLHALYAANQIIVAAGAGLALWLFGRAKRLWFGLAALGVALAAPPALTFALEGRYYVGAQFCCLALAAAVLTRLDSGARPGDLPLFIALSTLASLSHLFGALFAGCLGAALAALAFRRSEQETILGFAIGATACAVTAIWMSVAYSTLFGEASIVAWIPGSPEFLFGQFWFFNKMLSGIGANGFVLAVVLAACIWHTSSRTYAILFFVTLGLFCLLPLLATLWRPIIVGRYLAIAAPALTLIALFAGNSAWQSGRASAVLTAGGASLYALLLVLSGPMVSDRMTYEGRFPFRTHLVREGLARCENARVRVYIPAGPSLVSDVYRYAYAFALNRAEVDLVGSDQPSEDIARYPCAIIAWGEQGDLNAETDAQMLQALGLANEAGVQLTIERDGVGFLVKRAEGAPN